MKIYLTQDIFAEKLKVKMPETELEKETLLEILQNRLKLDRLVRLANEKLRIKTKINEAVELTESGKDEERLNALRTELAKKGNLEAVMETLDKNIAKEKAVKKDPLSYFESVRNLEENYLDHKILTSAKVERFNKQVRQNNINKDGQYTTQELIDIIREYEPGSKYVSSKPKTETKQKIKLSKQQFLDTLSKQYEIFMRENINFYRNENAGVPVIRRIADSLFREKFSNCFEKYPETEKYMDKIYFGIKNKFISVINSLGQVKIFQLEEAFADMDSLIRKIKTTENELDSLREGLQDSVNEKLINEKETLLKQYKTEWCEYLQELVNAENYNREILTKNGRGREYGYLTDLNKEINRLKEAGNIMKENNGSFPEDVWKRILNKEKLSD